MQDLEVTIMALYMVCPYCNKEETNVVDSRKNNEGNSIRRRRECPRYPLSKIMGSLKCATVKMRARGWSTDSFPFIID